MRRYVIDTNCLLMAIPRRSAYHRMLTAFWKGQYILCLSNGVVAEYEEILSAKIGRTNAVALLEALLRRPNILMVSPSFRFNLITEDPDDNKFVDCAIASNATCIVTNDKHFRALAQIPFPQVPTMNIRAFTALLEQNED